MKPESKPNLEPLENNLKPAKKPSAENNRRIVFAIGGKGGTGKTTIFSAITDYIKKKKIDFTLIDADTENKEKSSLSQFFPEAKKVNIRTERGLDSFIDELFDGTKNLAIADLGAGSGDDTFKWFDKMHAVLSKEGVLFTAVGVMVTDPGSIESIFNWASRLQNRVTYLIIKNERDGDNFGFFDDTEEGKRFVELAQPVILHVEKRETDIQHELNAQSVTLQQALSTKNGKVNGELKRISTVLRMRGLAERFETELAKADHLLLP